MFKKKVYAFLILFLLLVLYIYLGYFTQRYETSQLFLLYFLSFSFYLVYYLRANTKFLLKAGLLAAVIYRLVLMFSMPVLSDDFYRFAWDGHLIRNGENPFSNPPSYYVENFQDTMSATHLDLYEKMNSPGYHTIYPPVIQAVSFLSVFIFPEKIFNQVIVMRLFILLADLGIILLLLKLLPGFGKEKSLVLLFALNPLIILEHTGNIHFEGVAIFFLLLMFYMIKKGNIYKSALPMAFAVSTKLNPLIIMPVFLRMLKTKKLISFYLLTGIITLLMFIPFLSTDFIQGMTSSIGLYFRKFEFNASLYYLVREIGFWYKGYNIIQTAGIYLAFTVFIFIMTFSLFKKYTIDDLPAAVTWIFLIYLVFASIIHPWYITPLIAFCLFTRFRFPIIWSAVIFLSYAGYHQQGYSEPYWLIFTEYLILFGWIIIELFYAEKLEKLIKHIKPD